MNELHQKLPLGFLEGDDVVKIAKALLGKILATHIEGKVCKGRIIEVEAYNGRIDKACHAYGGRQTKRNMPMYGSAGTAYVYLCYGIHHLFNIVTNAEGFADAVLVRALEPIEGQATMKERLLSKNEKLTNGPGLLAKAMGITLDMTGVMLKGDQIWLEEAPRLPDSKIMETTRIGIDYAEEDVLLPWRFYEKGNDWVSKK